MRVEAVVPALPAAGMEIVVARMVRRMARRGVEVAVTCTEAAGNVADDLEKDGISVSVVPTPGILTNFRAPALEARIRNRAPDVVHVHSGAWLKAATAARRSGVPVVVHTAHGLLDREPPYGPWMKRRAARLTDQVTVVSQPLRDYFVQRVGLDPSQVEVIANGVDTELFAPGRPDLDLRRSWGFDTHHLVIGIVARFAPVKNHRLLVDAFSMLSSRVSEARLVLVGDGALRADLEAQVKAAGVEDKVHFAGALSGLERVYRAFDVFVLSSVAEGTSLSILEAMATGLCVVATAVGGNVDLLSDDHGALTPTGEARGLALTLERVLRDADLRQRLGQRARMRVAEMYSEEAMVERYLSMFQGIRRMKEAAPCAG